MAKKAKQRISYVLPLANQKGGHRLGVNGLAVDSDNSILYSGGRDGVICAWDLHQDLKNAIVQEWDAKPIKSQPSTFRQQVQAHTHWINDIALVQSNQALVSASSDISVKIWRPAAGDGLPPQPLGLHTDYVKVLAVPSLNSDWIASGGLDRKINVWDLNGAGQRLSIDVGNDEGGSLSSKDKGSVYALAATENVIAGGGPESTIWVWDSRTGKRVTKLVGHTDNIRDCLVSADGTTIMTASSDRTVKVWSTVAGRCMFTLTMHDASVWSLYSTEPDLSVFYSSDRHGMVVKTDTRGQIELDEGISVDVAQEHEGVHKVVAAGDSVWTATSRPSINRWIDVNTDDAEIDVPDNFSMHPRSTTSMKPRIPSPTSQLDGLSRQRSNSAWTRKIPLRYILRLSNTVPFPMPAASSDNDRRSVTMEKQPSQIDTQESIPTQPVRQQPVYSIEGQNGLIKHVMLNDRRRVLTLDTAGEVAMWDILRCVPIKSFGKRDIDEVRDEETTTMTVANWCTVDTWTGSVSVTLEENSCFDAEMYADELDLDENIEFREDQRINLGKWVLRYLFANLISEEIIRDQEYRQQLLRTATDKKLQRDNAPRSIPMPRSQTNGWHENGPGSGSTLRPSNGHGKPTTPGLTVTSAPFPGQSSIGSPMKSMASPNALTSTIEEDDADNAPSRSSTDRTSGDYFARRAPSNDMPVAAPVNQPPATPGESAVVDDATSPLSEGEAAKGAAGKEAGLFGKKFSMRGMSFGSMKKIGRLQGTEKDKPAVAEEKAESAEAEGVSAKNVAPRIVEDNFLGAIQKIRYGYDDSIQQQLANRAQHENGLPVPPPKELEVPSAIAPSLPAETPVLKPPSNTTILIQEERPEAGGVADLFEGTVGAIGEQCDLVEKTAPMWLGEVLLRNQIPPKEVVKISFVLEPQQGSGLPTIAADGNNRLNANRMLRAKKILGYVAERVDPPLQKKEGVEKQPEDDLKPEDFLELWCQGQLVHPTMTLASIRAHLWRGGGDIALYYKANGKKAILGAAAPSNPANPVSPANAVAAA